MEGGGANAVLDSLQPITGVVYLEGSGVTSDFQSLRGKRIGYVGASLVAVVSLSGR